MMPCSPRSHGIEHWAQCLAVFRECVFDVRYFSADNRTGDDPGTFQFTQMLGEDLATRLRDKSPEFAEPPFALFERIQDQRLPLSTDHLNRHAHRAFRDLHRHTI